MRRNYFRKLEFKLDMLSLLPLDLLYFAVGFNSLLRAPRYFKIKTFLEFYNRFDQAAKSPHLIRVAKTMTYMVYLIHVETCGYYAVSVYEGIGSNKWVYNGEGNAYVRCFYLATKTSTSIGNNPTPTNTLEYVFMTVYWLSGVFVFALLIGQPCKVFRVGVVLVTSSDMVQLAHLASDS
ncbi:cyclic nucleotide-gated cation channel beta-3-like [Lingula anatina]|uniref:Cyclic nucleotide-gated cation channel beta-3-like n=1 Tax=Lingula anatina TaxID=7574 RepID=A0A1S3JVJ5_LINAN|nr:cyclic nucleotide-gated cation channel beta-3-like [Lingula anatina]|eukprot:XP_013414109.1 cyclic nucleotide-gated cation channel beta-3-like [Lingula anatina]